MTVLSNAAESRYDNTVMVTTPTVGDLLRTWRVRRRLSQVDLAQAASVSAKHVSFLETGRSAPSRGMLLRMATCMDLPLRATNQLLAAAGFAALYRERALDDPGLVPARQGIEAVLSRHDPYPAFAIDAHWMLVSCNKSLHRMAAGADPMLLRAPINILRLFLHPAGLAPRIANLREWRDHVTGRLRRQHEQTADPRLGEMLAEIASYPLPPPGPPQRTRRAFDGVVVPFRLVTIDGTLSFLPATTTFASPLDVTLSEVTIESFFPADAETSELMRQMAQQIGGRSREEIISSVTTLNRYPVMKGDDPPPFGLPRGS